MINIIRTFKNDNGIRGKVYLNGQFICFSLEHPTKAIPCGIYGVENSKSPKFKRELPLLYNTSVKPSRGIRIHRGNDAVKDSQGCVLVGMGQEGDKLTESANAEVMLTMLCRHRETLVISEDY